MAPVKRTSTSGFRFIHIQLPCPILCGAGLVNCCGNGRNSVR